MFKNYISTYCWSHVFVMKICQWSKHIFRIHQLRKKFWNSLFCRYSNWKRRRQRTLIQFWKSLWSSYWTSRCQHFDNTEFEILLTSLQSVTHQYLAVEWTWLRVDRKEIIHLTSLLVEPHLPLQIEAVFQVNVLVKWLIFSIFTTWWKLQMKMTLYIDA